MTQKITVRDALDIAIQNEPQETDIELLAEELGVPYDMMWRVDEGFLEDDLDELCERPFDEWLCTDTIVGKRVVYLHHAPVAITVKPARKSNTEIYWLSEQDRETVRDYLIEKIRWDDLSYSPTYISNETELFLEGDNQKDS